MIELICKICSKKFEVRNYRKGKAKFCSYKCYHISTKGKPTWNKNKQWSPEMRKKMSDSHKTSLLCKKWLKKLHKQSKGKHLSPKTEFKKGHKPTNFKGRTKHFLGYIWIYKPNHPFCGVKKVVLEHRLVVEEMIGRYLTPKETVHHINEVKDDNRPQNLMAFISKSAHIRFHSNPDNVKPSEIIFDGRKS